MVSSFQAVRVALFLILALGNELEPKSTHTQTCEDADNQTLQKAAPYADGRTLLQKAKISRQRARTWREWRWQQESYESVQEEGSSFLLVDAIDLTKFVNQCGHLFKPAAATKVSIGYETCPPEKTSSQNLYVKMAGQVDHVYYLCIDCDHVRVPETAKDKVSLVQANDMDECMSQAGADHGIKVTQIHRLMLAHAQARGFSNLAVFEEDFAVDPGCTKPATMDEFFTDRIIQKDFQQIRLTYKWFGGSNPCKSQCMCHYESHGICKVNAGCEDLHSSAGYILDKGAYSRFLGVDVSIATCGLIDMAVLAANPSLVTVPPLGHQLHERLAQNDAPAVEAREAKEFEQNCYRERKLPRSKAKKRKP